jgi:hypothetical protein
VNQEEQGTIMALINLRTDSIEFAELKEAFGQSHVMLKGVAQYSQPIREVQSVCDHPQRIIELQR